MVLKERFVFSPEECAYCNNWWFYPATVLLLLHHRLLQPPLLHQALYQLPLYRLHHSQGHQSQRPQQQHHLSHNHRLPASASLAVLVGILTCLWIPQSQRRLQQVLAPLLVQKLMVCFKHSGFPLWKNVIFSYHLCCRCSSPATVLGNQQYLQPQRRHRPSLFRQQILQYHQFPRAP